MCWPGTERAAECLAQWDSFDTGCVIQAWAGLGGQEALAACMWDPMTPSLQGAFLGAAAWAVRLSSPTAASCNCRDHVTKPQSCCLMGLLLSISAAQVQHLTKLRPAPMPYKHWAGLASSFYGQVRASIMVVLV